ncbi:MAG: hypothetical protein LC749_08335, partial [Actinobacteria bacterium]|nr:hypothetical protein [Actinomycetota bacterium]
MTLRHLGRGHGRSPDHRPHDGYSALAGAGVTHDIRRDRQLYGVEINYQPTTAAPTDWAPIASGTGGTAAAEPRFSC